MRTEEGREALKCSARSQLQALRSFPGHEEKVSRVGPMPQTGSCVPGVLLSLRPLPKGKSDVAGVLPVTLNVFPLL